MKKNSVLLTSLFLLLAAACSHDTLPVYEDVDRVFFKWARPTNDVMEIVGKSSDQIKVNLGYDNPVKNDSTIFVEVSMMGFVSDQNRPISAEVIKNESSAVEGHDIEILPSFIPAGEVEGKLGIKVKNSEKLTNTTLMARLRLAPNEYFHVDYTQTRVSGNKNGLEYNVYFDAKADMPSLWADASAAVQLNAYFGPYSNVKLQVICEVCGFTRDYFMHDPGTENALDVLNARLPATVAMGLISQVNRYLKQYEKENGEPLKDENGSVIYMGLPIDRY
jgi:hypothetical protein